MKQNFPSIGTKISRDITLAPDTERERVAAMFDCKRMSNLTPHWSFPLPRILAYLLHITVFVYLGLRVVRFFIIVRQTLPRFARQLRDFVRFGKWIALLLAFLLQLLSEIRCEVNVSRRGSFHMWSIAFRCFFPSFSFFTTPGFLWRSGLLLKGHLRRSFLRLRSFGKEEQHHVFASSRSKRHQKYRLQENLSPLPRYFGRKNQNFRLVQVTVSPRGIIYTSLCILLARNEIKKLRANRFEITRSGHFTPFSPSTEPYNTNLEHI